MPFPSNTPGSKLDRAIVAYILTLGDTYNANNTCPANYNVGITYPNVTVSASTGTPSERFTGCNTVNVTIRFEFSAVQAVGDTSQAARIQMDAFVGAVVDALQTGNSAEQNFNETCRLINRATLALATANPDTDGDLADFNLLYWMNDGFARGKPDDPNTAWVEQFNFIADVACVNCAQLQ